ncbi:MAG: energy transducer TonB [Candidatus Acidiferrales bacterium]
MQRSSALRALAVTLLIATAPCAFGRSKRPKFTPPSLATAASITYPIDSAAAGVVVVAVNLDDAGKIKNTDVLRDIPSLTSPVLLSIQKWTFRPATLDGAGVDSTITVSVVFNPSDFRLAGTENPALGKEVMVLPQDANGFLPPKTTTASWANYPLNSVAQGAVVLEAHVSRSGQVTHVIPVWAPFLAKTSIEAVEKWTFQPATFDGRSINANAVIGYVYRPPNIAVPVAPFRPTQP